MKHITTATELDETKSSGITFVKFSSNWCGPCKALIPVFDQLDAKNQDVNFLSVNIDFSPELTAQYQVEKIPTVIVFQNGEEKIKSIGAKQEVYYQNIINELKNETKNS